jgi:plastocyanin
MNPERDPLFRIIVVTMLTVVVIALVFVLGIRQNLPAGGGRQTAALVSAVSTTSTYRPVIRNFIITTVPLLVHEQTGTFDYLGKDFGKKGILRDKEVWAFSPSSLTVYEGDTVRITVVNPSGDDHTFTLSSVGFDLYVKAQSKASGSFVVPKTGPFTFVCTIAEHSPYMSGQLVVLPDSDAPQS